MPNARSAEARLRKERETPASDRAKDRVPEQSKVARVRESGEFIAWVGFDEDGFPLHFWIDHDRDPADERECATVSAIRDESEWDALIAQNDEGK